MAFLISIPTTRGITKILAVLWIACLSFRLPQTNASFAATPSSSCNEQVIALIGMAISTVGFGRVLGRHSIAAHYINSWGYRLQMPGITASSVETQMVKLKSLVNLAYQYFIHGKVSHSDSSLAPRNSNREDSVTMPIASPEPVPTASVGISFYGLGKSKVIGMWILHKHQLYNTMTILVAGVASTKG